ncbi:MAG: ABC transporter ATP-binding protein [Deinococcales bacterium]
MTATISATREAVKVQSVVKIFQQQENQIKALDDVSLEIRDNEFFTLLGPSGCGKTTLLRLIAGFESPSQGEILLFGQRIEQLAPFQRPVNTVFQHYALFPHMNVYDNIAFGLKMLGKDATEIDKVVKEVLSLVKMSDYAKRKPYQLSGGQQQRIAFARALAPHPKVLLLDEPLSALDLKLRQAMRSELKSLQRETGITFIFVTHDQEEALTMSDRIGVMSEGKLQQVGSPLDIYERPLNRFVADFIGKTNFLEARLEASHGEVLEAVLANGLKLHFKQSLAKSKGERISLALRPEKIQLKALNESVSGNLLKARILDRTYLGTDTSYQVDLGQGIFLEVRDQNALSGNARFALGDEVLLDIAPQAFRLLQD